MIIALKAKPKSDYEKLKENGSINLLTVKQFMVIALVVESIFGFFEKIGLKPEIITEEYFKLKWIYSLFFAWIKSPNDGKENCSERKATNDENLTFHEGMVVLCEPERDRCELKNDADVDIEKIPYWLSSSEVGVYGKPAPVDFTGMFDQENVDRIDLREIITAMVYCPDGKGGVVGTMDGTCQFYDIIDSRLQLGESPLSRLRRRDPITIMAEEENLNMVDDDVGDIAPFDPTKKEEEDEAPNREKKWDQIFNALQKCIQNLHKDRLLLDGEVKYLQGVVHKIKKEQKFESLKAELLLVSKEREAAVYKHRFENVSVSDGIETSFAGPERRKKTRRRPHSHQMGVDHIQIICLQVAPCSTKSHLRGGCWNYVLEFVCRLHVTGRWFAVSWLCSGSGY